MICHFHDTVFSIQNTNGSTKYDIDFGKPVWITTARLSPNKRKVAIVGSDDFTVLKGGPIKFRKPAQLWLVDLDTMSKKVVAVQVADDVLWTSGGKTLLFSTGKQIVTYDIPSGVRNEHFRFSRTAQGTNAFSLSPDGSKASYLYWKRDSRYIGIYDFNNSSGSILSTTCFSYTWLDNKTILHDTNASGLKSLDLSNLTSRQYLKNLTTLMPQLENLQVNPSWITYLSSQVNEVYESVGKPKHYGDRIYFVGQAFLLNKPAITGLFSMKRDKTDLQIHYQCFQCWIERLEFIDSGQMIALYIRRYANISRNEYEWVYIGEESERVPKGYMPLVSDQPSVFGAYAYNL